MTVQNNDKNYQDKLFQLMISSSEIYDQNIFKLATIISSASLAIIKLYPETYDKCFQYFSWVLFIFAITTSLVSLLLTQYSAAKKFKNNDGDSDYNSGFPR